MSKLVSVLAVSALFVTVAWGVTLSSSGEHDSGCDSTADVVRHLDRSRNGISLACAEFLKRNEKFNGTTGDTK